MASKSEKEKVKNFFLIFLGLIAIGLFWLFILLLTVVLFIPQLFAWALSSRDWEDTYPMKIVYKILEEVWQHA